MTVVHHDDPETLACQTCGKVHCAVELGPRTAAHCTRCGFAIARHQPHSLHRTAAFALAALFMYWPANALPILRINMYGKTTDNTALQGSIRLFEAGDFTIAVVVFLASILIPLLKIMGLLVLVASVWIGSARMRVARARLIQAIEAVGRWAMLDVFMVAILVSLVKLQGLASIVAGPGLFAFGALVVLTTLSSASFDSKALWRDVDEQEGEPS